MRNVQFNFNNEVDTFEVLVNEEDGRVQIPGPTGPMAEYDSMQQFAEIYAQARDVKPENLKNWTLVENGDVMSFVLRAGTAGVTTEELGDKLTRVLDTLRAEGNYHPLSISRVTQELQGSVNVVNTLAMSQAADVAREVYDRLDAMHAFDEPEEEPEEVDERSEVEKYLDAVMERDKTLAFFARLLNLDSHASKEEILNAFTHSSIPYTVDMLASLYNDALNAAKEGINVDSHVEALMVCAQAVPGIPSEDAKNRMVVAANMARRDKANITVFEVGQHHIRKTATLLNLTEVMEQDVYMFENTPVIVNFNPDVDAELEAEREAAETEDGSYDEDDEEDYGEEDYDEDDEEDYDEDDGYEPW